MWRRFCSSVPKSSRTAAHGEMVGDWTRVGILEADQLLVQRLLVGRGEALSAVGRRDADAGEAGIEQHALDLAIVGDLGELLLVGAVVAENPGQAAGIDRLEVGADPASGPDGGSCRRPSSSVRAHAAVRSLLDDAGDALPVLGRRAVQRPVDGVTAEVEVEVVLEGQSDAAVDLHAVLDELGAVVADEGLGRADQLVGLGGSRRPRPRPPRR